MMGGMYMLVTKYLQSESDLYYTGVLREYYINDFPVSRGEFLYHFGELSQEDIEEFKNGNEIERDGKVFRVDNWRGF